MTPVLAYLTSLASSTLPSSGACTTRTNRLRATVISLFSDLFLVEPRVLSRVRVVVLSVGLHDPVCVRVAAASALNQLCKYPSLLHLRST